MTTVNIYITFDGNCEEAFTFYKSIFGGEFQYIGRYKDIPSPEEMPQITAKEDEKIMHISLPGSRNLRRYGGNMSTKTT